MNLSFDIWKMLAGVAIFIVGMGHLEDSLKQLAGRPFKLFLKQQTSNKLKAIGGGTVVTALLQSSSVVNLMVLAFVGAGVITMQNALAVIMGANLGTTLSSWIVATVGFSFNIEEFALPIIAVAGIIKAFSRKDSGWDLRGSFLLGFGFLFFGLDLIKNGMIHLVSLVDLKAFDHLPSIVYLFVGIIMTSLIQSSSATMAIVLSALFVKAISLYTAAAIVLGSEVGTTIKLIIAAMNGAVAKRRVALGNFLFNIITSLLVFLFLRQVIWLITDVIGVHDQLVSLVLFQTIVNILGILLFYPFLSVFGRFLEGRFKDDEDDTLFISKATVSETDLAIVAVRKETLNLMHHVIGMGLDIFGLTSDRLKDIPLHHSFKGHPVKDQYEYIKHLHGEIHAYAIQLRRYTMNAEDTETTERLMAAVRNCMYAAKSVKDAMPDLEQLHNSSNDHKYAVYLQARQQTLQFYESMMDLLQHERPEACFDRLVSIYDTVTAAYSTALKELYLEMTVKQLSEVELSTLINFNRQMVTSLKALVFGAKDLLLDTGQAAFFDDLPGFIR